MFKKIFLRSVLSSILIGAMVTISLPTMATNEAMSDLLKILRNKGSISAEEYELLSNAVKADEEKVEGNFNEIKTNLDKKTKKLPKFDIDKGKLKVSSQDGQHSFQIGGRIMYDVGFVDNDDVANLESGHEFRRARVFFKGQLWKDWGFKFQTDFADNTVDNKEWTISYKGFKPTTIIIGQDKEPFSLEEMTSSKYITFMERALPNAFAPGRNPGIQATTHMNNFTLAGGVFGSGFDTQDTNPAWSLTGRATWAPIVEKDKVVHLGVAGSYRNLDSGNQLRVRARPEFHIANTRLIDTGSITGTNYNLLGLEAAVVYGPFSAQAEWMRANLEATGTSDLDYTGYYVYGSYYITGESRKYDSKSGAFKQTKVLKPLGKGGIGAWEVGLRFSNMDLTDGIVTGGEEDNMTAGINWYPNNNLRFMVNYIKVLDFDRTGNTNNGKEPSAFMLRSQLYY